MIRYSRQMSVLSQASARSIGVPALSHSKLVRTRIPKTRSGGSDSAATAEQARGKQCPVERAVKQRFEDITNTDPIVIEKTLEDLELPTFKEKWGIFAVYCLWMILVCLQLFRVELGTLGVPDAVIDVAVSGTTATLALSWDQLVAGPRRNKAAQMEAAINAKLDLQQQLARKRDEVEMDIRARLELNERVQQQRSLLEEQIAEKLSQLPESAVMIQAASRSAAPAGPASVAPQNQYEMEPAVKSNTLNVATAPKRAVPLSLELDISGAGGAAAVASLAGMKAQLSQASFQPADETLETGVISLNLQIKFSPADRGGSREGNGSGNSMG